MLVYIGVEIIVQIKMFLNFIFHFNSTSCLLFSYITYYSSLKNYVLYHEMYYIYKQVQVLKKIA